MVGPGALPLAPGAGPTFEMPPIFEMGRVFEIELVGQDEPVREIRDHDAEGLRGRGGLPVLPAGRVAEVALLEPYGEALSAGLERAHRNAAALAPPAHLFFSCQKRTLLFSEVFYRPVLDRKVAKGAFPERVGGLFFLRAYVRPGRSA